MDSEKHNPLETDFDGKKNIFSKFLLSLKKRFFKVFHITLSNGMITKNFVMIFSAIEVLQILSFSFDEIFKTTWTIQEYESLYYFFRKIINFFLISPFFIESSIVLYKIILCVFASFVYLLFILFLFLFFVSKKISLIPLWTVYTFRIFADLFLPVLMLPCMITFEEIFDCNSFVSKFNYDRSFCDEDWKIFFPISLIGFVLTCLFGFCFALLFFDMKISDNKDNDSSREKDEIKIDKTNVKKEIKRFENLNYLARDSNINNVYLFFSKLILSLCFINLKKHFNRFDDNSNISLAVVMFLFSVFYYIIIKRMILFFSILTRKLFLYCSKILMITNFLILFEKILRKFHSTDFNWFFEVWFLTCFVSLLYNFYKPENYSEELINYSKDKNSIRNGLLLIRLLRIFMDNHSYNPVQHKILVGFIYYHSDNCHLPDCQLKKIINEEHSEQNIIHFINFYNEVYIHFINLYPNDVKLRVSYAYFLLDKMKNINLSKLQMYIAYMCGPHFCEEFSLYRLEKIIQEKYLHLEDDNLSLDIASSIIYNQYFKVFKEAIQKLSVFYVDFWMSFVQDDMSVKKIKKKGFMILVLIRKVFYNWKKMKNLKPKDKESLKMFGSFLTDIMNDQVLGQQYLEKSKELSNMGIQIGTLFTDIYQLTEDGSPVIISRPGNDKKNLIISQATSSITRLFGYQKIDLIGKDVNILLPEECRMFHTKAITNFIAKNFNLRSSSTQKKTSCVALSKTGYVFPVKLNIILIPNLTGTPNVATMFKKVLKLNTSYTGYILTDQELDILHTSSQCNFLFNFNEKGNWEIKNYKKIKLEERVNLSRLVKELESYHNDRLCLQTYIKEPYQVVHIKKYTTIYRENLQKEKKKSLDSGKGIYTYRSSITTSKGKTARSGGNTSRSSIKIVDPPINQVYLVVNRVIFGEEYSGLYLFKLIYYFPFNNLPTFYISRLGSPVQGALNTGRSLNVNPSTDFMPPYILDIQFQKKKVIDFIRRKNIYALIEAPKKNSGAASYLKLLKKGIKKQLSSYRKSKEDSRVGEGDVENENSLGEEEEEEEEEEDVYNTLRFKNYAKEVIFYALDPVTMTACPDQSKITKEGKLCSDLKTVFGEETLSIEDYLSDEAKEGFRKTKYEIQKVSVFESYDKNSFPSTINSLRIFSIGGMVIMLGLALSSFLYYLQFLNKCEIYTLGLVKISSILNCTLSSADTFLNILLIQNYNLLDQETKIIGTEYLVNLLLENSKKMNSLVSVGDEKSIFVQISKDISENFLDDKSGDPRERNPLIMNLTHFITFQGKALVTSEEEMNFNEAMFRMMASIYALTSTDTTYDTIFAPNQFLLCYNSINQFYESGLTFIYCLVEIISSFTPKKTQLTIIIICICISALMYILLFLILRESLEDVSKIIKEMISLKNDELQYTVKQGEKFEKKIRGCLFLRSQDADNEDEGSKEEERENEFKMLTEKQKNQGGEKEKQQNRKRKIHRHIITRNMIEKIKRPLRDDLILIVVELFVFLVMIAYFVIQFFILSQFNRDLDHFSYIFSLCSFYLFDLSLLSNGIKFKVFLKEKYSLDPDEMGVTILGKSMTEEIPSIFGRIIENKQDLNKEIVISEYLSENFTEFYNTHLFGDNPDDLIFVNVDVETISLLRNGTFDMSHTFYYNSLMDFSRGAGSMSYLLKLFVQSNTVKNRILIPFMKEFSEALYYTIESSISNKKHLVLIFFSLFFVLLLLLYFAVWRPMEVWLDKTVRF